jgi:hypothetical protein
MQHGVATITTRIQPCRDAYIGLQYGYFGCNKDQLHLCMVIDKWLHLERCNSFLHPFDVVLQYDGFAMHKKTNTTMIWLQARILLPAEGLRESLLRRNTWLQYDIIAMNELVAK